MKYKSLVVNGCSYMELYAQGNGHTDLASELGIAQASSLAIGGSANSRIIRTTLKHSYEADSPVLYVLGMTFLSRNEIPILRVDDDWEGPWTNPQNQDFRDRWMPEWQQRDSDLYVKQKLKVEMYSTLYRLEDLQFKLLSMINDLKSRGHQALIFQQADDLHIPFMDDSKLRHFSYCKNIVGGYSWRAVPWQHEQGVAVAYHDGPDSIHVVPDAIKHRAAGDHHVLNRYLTRYLIDQTLL